MNNKWKMKVVKIFLFQILIAIPLYVMAGLILHKLGFSDKSLLWILVAFVLCGVSLWLALVIMYKKVLLEEIRIISLALFLASVAIGIINILLSGGFADILYSPIYYFVTRFYLQRKLGKINEPTSSNK